MPKRTFLLSHQEPLRTQLSAFWQGVAHLEQKHRAYFSSTPSRRSEWNEPQPSTLAENLMLQCQVALVRLSLHPSLSEEIALDTRALFQQLLWRLALLPVLTSPNNGKPTIF